MNITPDMMLRAYAAGYFPMAPDQNSDDLDWYDPEMRAILPLVGFHLSRRLARTALSDKLQVTTNKAFEAVINGCASSAPGRETTWINSKIFDLFCALHFQGYAHSVEVWQGAELVGGLYGASLGGAFFGESMFSTQRDTSKVALVHLVARLRLCHFVLLDTQFTTTHLEQFGCEEIPSGDYKHRLAKAVRLPVLWRDDLEIADVSEEIRRMRQADF